MFFICKNLTVFIMLGSFVGTNQNKKSKFIFEITQAINELNKPKVIEERKIEIPVPNSFLKPFTALRDANDPIIDRICKKTACSCGRSGFMCDSQDVFNVANEVDEVINNIDRQMRSEDNQANNDVLRCGQKCKKHKNRQWVRHSFTGDLNISNIEEDFKDQMFLDAVLMELININIPGQRNKKLVARIALTPEDIYKYYRSAMDHVRETVFGFVKYRTGSSLVRGLPREIRKGIQAIRNRYRHFKVTDKSLKRQIFHILLDDILKIKIVPNKDPDVSYDILMPDWMYLELLKKKRLKQLRTGKRSVQKRLLPLTSQQKIRLHNKLGPKKLLKFVWRRSIGTDSSQYGVPFTLDIQGLGQLN